VRSCHCLFLAAILVAPALARAQESAADAVNALLDEYKSRERAYFDAARESGSKADYRQHPAREYLPRFKELAEKYAGQTAALPALGWILDQAGRPSIEDPKAETLWVVERLTRDHAGQPEIAATLAKVQYTGGRLAPETVHALYDAVLAQNPDHTVLGQATFQNAVYVARASEKSDDPKPIRQQALKLLREVKKTYKDTKYAQEADGWLFELQKLQVGMKAPELVGVDLNGKAIRLSDYAGSVVVLDFWKANGFSREAMPRERALTILFEGQPFTIIGINTDYDRKRMDALLRENQVNWSNIYDGPDDGPLTKEWHVQGWPTRYVLDRHGIIRYRGSDFEQLDQTVRDLMKKMPPAKKGKKP
jgi:peroxiredoxin